MSIPPISPTPSSEGPSHSQGVLNQNKESIALISALGPVISSLANLNK